MRHFALPIGALTLFVLVGCKDTGPVSPEEKPTDDSQVTIEDVKREATQAAETTITLSKQKMEQYKDEVQDKAVAIDQKVQKLRKRSDELTGQAKEDLANQLEQLDEKRKLLQQQLDQLASASADAWEDLKPGLEAARNDLEKAYEEAAANFE